LGSSKRRKALKSEAQECWELKEAPKGIEAKGVERVAKPWGRIFHLTGERWVDALSEGKSER